jgi:hypothetical protein
LSNILGFFIIVPSPALASGTEFWHPLNSGNPLKSAFLASVLLNRDLFHIIHLVKFSEINTNSPKTAYAIYGRSEKQRLCDHATRARGKGDTDAGLKYLAELKEIKNVLLIHSGIVCEFIILLICHLP